jgi:uncharacterized YceG family protein
MRRLVLGVILLVVASVCFVGIVASYLGDSPLDLPVTPSVNKVIVTRGMTPQDVADRLGLDRKLFSWGWEKMDLRLYAGYIYCVPKRQNTTYFDVLQAFKRPCAVLYVKVTFPEGITIKQMDRILHVEAGTPTGAFLKSANAPRILSRISKFVGKDVNTSEGFMYPDTYYFDGKVDALVDSMFDNFLQKVDGIDWNKAQSRTGLDKYQIIILASIVEKEAVKKEEAPIIAGVFINRLRRGMRLESCPTVEYALGVHKEVLSYKDLEIDSPYNTYKHQGLPPTPICNPSITSILAVVNYQETDYLYFVADGHGGHLFARTYQEHLENIRRVREKR